MQAKRLSAGQSIDNNLKPKLQWLSQLGLGKSQMAKAVIAFPGILRYRVQQNLKPTVRWLLDLGVNKTQVAKAVATNPAILGLQHRAELEADCRVAARFGSEQDSSCQGGGHKPCHPWTTASSRT